MKNMFADFSQITSAKLSVSDSEKQPEGLTSLKKRRERRGKERREEERRGKRKGKRKTTTKHKKSPGYILLH